MVTWGNEHHGLLALKTLWREEHLRRSISAPRVVPGFSSFGLPLLLSGGNSSAVQEQLQDVRLLRPSGFAFAALRAWLRDFWFRPALQHDADRPRQAPSSFGASSVRCRWQRSDMGQSTLRRCNLATVVGLPKIHLAYVGKALFKGTDCRHPGTKDSRNVQRQLTDVIEMRGSSSVPRLSLLPRD